MKKYIPEKDSAFRGYRKRYMEMSAEGERMAAMNAAAANAGYGNDYASAAAALGRETDLRALQSIVPKSAALDRQQELNEAALDIEADRMRLAKEVKGYERARDAGLDFRADMRFDSGQESAESGRKYRLARDTEHDAIDQRKTELSESRADRRDAYSWCVTLLKAGILPNTPALISAGIDPGSALRLAEKYGYREKD